MRVAFYAPLKPPDHPVPSGDRRMARLLMAALALGGHEVTVASRLRSYEGSGEPARQRAIAGRGAARARALIAGWLAAPPEGRPQAWLTYHLYHKAPDWLGPPVSRALGIPYLVAEASHAPKRAGGAWDLGHRAAAAAIAGATLVLMLNPADGECLLPLLEGPERLRRLPPFIDTAPYRRARSVAPVARAARRISLGLDVATPLLLSVAMMRPGDKLASYRLLADALGRLADRPWHVLLAGDGPARPDVEAAFARFDRRVTFLGALGERELPGTYAAADLYAWPAINEAWGMTLLEAQASGLAVVAGAFGGVPAIVADGVTGLLTTPGDVGAFAAALGRLLDSPEERSRLGTAAAARMAAEHDIAAAARRLDAALSDALAMPRPAAAA
ncbi:MAG: glycosyltransferase family 4 protein [Dongiaceae bacterium]